MRRGVDSRLVARAVPGNWGSIAVRCCFDLFVEVTSDYHRLGSF